MNRSIFLVRIKKRYKSLTYYKDKTPIQEFLVEIRPKGKEIRSCFLKMKVVGKKGSETLNLCKFNQYVIVEGALSLAPWSENLKCTSKHVLELNAYTVTLVESLS